MKPLFCCWFAAACACFADEPPLVMGKDWFAKLRDPKTRVEALYQMEKAGITNGNIEDIEEFTAGHRRVLVFPCPQPGHPDAWAIVNPATWTESHANLRGLEAETYEPHPLEIERRGKWDSELAGLPADFKPWRPGQAWFETLSGDLVDPTGRELGGFFASPGILADFNGDGMLDLLEIQRLSIEVGGNKWDSALDCVSIGPLDGEKTPYASVYANLRKDAHKTPRSWRFAVHGEPGALRLALVPEDKSQQEISFGFRDGTLAATVDKLPKGILLDARPEGEDGYHASVNFLKRHGHDMAGVGSDDGCEVLADFAGKPQEEFSFDSVKIALPDTGDAAPRDAARLLADHAFNSAFYRSQYELASIGDPAKPATRGWLERWCEAGWGMDTVDLWWLDGDKAERWQQKDAIFLVSRVSAAELGRRIAVAHEIDRIRTVPVQPFPAVAKHESMGGADFNIFRVRAMSQSPESITSVFEGCVPPLWRWAGPEYDRKLSSLVATLYVSREPDPNAESKDIRALAPVWLDPERVSTIPPGLVRAAVVCIGDKRWKEMKPLLEKLQTKLGPPTVDEKRLDQINKIENGRFNRSLNLRGREEWLAERESNSMQRENRDLTVKLTGDIRFELRKPIAEALEKLKDSSSGRSSK